MYNPSEEEIQKNLLSQFPKDIRQWLKENDPELYKILLSTLLPKVREQLLLQEKLKIAEEDLKKLGKLLKDAEIEVAATTAALRFWERDTPVTFPGVKVGELSIGFWSIRPWAFLNILFDWILKIGLSVVPILSLFTIFAISNLSNIQYSPIVLVCILCGTSLVWLTSAAVINWIVSQEPQNEENDFLQPDIEEQNKTDGKLHGFYQSCFPLVTKLTKLIFPIPIFTSLIKIIVGTHVKITPNTLLFLTIWLLEALIGYATVPPLLDLARSNNINPETFEVDPLPPLTGEQKFEILLGVSIFAFINIIFAISKGRIYRVNTKKKIELGRAIARRDQQKKLLDDCRKEILKLDQKNQELEEILRPNSSIAKFHQGIESLSIWARQGKEYSDIPDDVPENDVTNNGKVDRSNIPVQDKSPSVHIEPGNTPD